MEFPIKIGDKWETVECPTSYYKTSTEAYQVLIERWKNGLSPEGMVEVFSALTGRPIDDYMASEDAKLERHILNGTRFVYVEDLETYPAPSTFLGVDYKNKNVGKMTFGQNLHVRKALEGKDTRTKIAYVVAVYLQPSIDEDKFDNDRALEIEKVILKMPIAEVFPVGFFFLTRLRNYGIQPRSFWHQTWSTIKSFGISARILLKLPRAIYLNRTQMLL